MREGTGGAHAAEFGECPAATEAGAAETGSGEKGCRACWTINARFSGEVAPGSVTNDLGDCLQCGFLNLKQNENTDDLYEILVREVISLM